MSSQLLPGHPVSVSMIANLKSRISYSIQVYYNVIAMSYYTYDTCPDTHGGVRQGETFYPHDMVMGGGNSQLRRRRLHPVDCP